MEELESIVNQKYGQPNDKDERERRLEMMLQPVIKNEALKNSCPSATETSKYVSNEFAILRYWTSFKGD